MLPSVGPRGCPPSLWPNEREVNLTIKEWFFFGLCYTVEVHIYHASNGGVHIAHTTRHEPRALCGDFLVSYICGATSKLCIAYSNITQTALWATCRRWYIVLYRMITRMWYVSNVSIIYEVFMLLYYHSWMFYNHFIATLYHFLGLTYWHSA